jgi:hypothetical protein
MGCYQEEKGWLGGLDLKLTSLRPKAGDGTSTTGAVSGLLCFGH